MDGDWRPNTFSKITFGITRDNQDSAQANTGGFVRNEVRLGVAHGFTTRTALIAGVRYSKDEFETTLGREDTRWAINVGVKHSMLRWLDVGVGIQALQRDSSDAQFDFQSNIIMFTISTVFD